MTQQVRAPHGSTVADLEPLRSAGSEVMLAGVRRKYPTGALATFELDGRWSELRPGGSELTELVTPTQLAKR